jgi:hypothetical protein
MKLGNSFPFEAPVLLSIFLLELICEYYAGVNSRLICHGYVIIPKTFTTDVIFRYVYTPFIITC